jgi:spermidine/putrescine transport system substrate-binding protein
MSNRPPLRRLLAAVLALTAPPALAADPELLVFDWSGYEDPNFFQAYIEKHGQGPTFAFFGDDDDAFQKFMSGFRADVTHPCSQMVPKFREAGLIEPWDTSRIPLFDSLDPAMMGSEIFRDAEGVWFMPAEWGATAIAYNTEVVPAEDVASLQVFVDPKYAGRISLPDNNDDVWSLAFLATGLTDWTKATEEDFQKAAAWLRRAHENVRTYWTDGAEIAQLMATGEVVIAWTWNETPTTMRAQGHPIAFQREPVEGSSSWFCGYLNLKDGPGSEDKAYDFINAWLEERTAHYIVEAWGYGHSNAAAMGTLDQAMLDDVGLGPISAPLLAQVPMDNQLRDRMLAEFEKIKSGF